MKNTPNPNAENKPAKKNWLKPQIFLLDTTNVAGGTHAGHYENNPSHKAAAATWSLHTPKGAGFLKTNTKSYYVS